MLQSPFKLSKEITTTQLADVVNGRENVPLPDWSRDEGFEAEIEEAIARSQVVLVCYDCDGIIGFFTTTRTIDLPMLVKGLGIVIKQERLACRKCGGRSLVWCNPSLFEEGKSIYDAIPSYHDFGASLSHRPSPAAPGLPRSMLLTRILKERYGQAEDPDLLSLTFAHSNRRLQMTPGQNVLGQVWDSVCQMAEEELPGVRSVAVGIAKAGGLFGSAYQDDEAPGSYAIVLHFGLFDILYVLNHLFDLLHKTTDEESKKDLLVKFREAVLGAALGNFSWNLGCVLPYQTDEDFWAAHTASICQQQFVLMHEVAHIMSWARRSAKDERRRPYSAEAYLEDEIKADAWAVEKIITRGVSYHDPAFQFRAVYLLFAYWDLISTAASANSALFIDPGQRWDQIRRLAHEQTANLPLDEYRSVIEAARRAIVFWRDYEPSREPGDHRRYHP